MLIKGFINVSDHIFISTFQNRSYTIYLLAASLLTTKIVSTHSFFLNSCLTEQSDKCKENQNYLVDIWKDENRWNTFKSARATA